VVLLSTCPCHRERQPTTYHFGQGVLLLLPPSFDNGVYRQFTFR